MLWNGRKVGFEEAKIAQALSKQVVMITGKKRWRDSWEVSAIGDSNWLDGRCQWEGPMEAVWPDKRNAIHKDMTFK